MAPDMPQWAIDLGSTNTDVVSAHQDGWTHFRSDRISVLNEDSIRQLTNALKEHSSRTLAVTGGQHGLLPPEIGRFRLVRIPEIEAASIGALELAGIEAHGSPVLVLSLGSGTAIGLCSGQQVMHVGGTGIGGGTLLGLGSALLGPIGHSELDALALKGNATKVDLTIGDVIGARLTHLSEDATAVNFGKLGRMPADLKPEREDLAAALVNMVGQTIVLMAVQQARIHGANRIVIVGHTPRLESVRAVIDAMMPAFFSDGEYWIPDNGGAATALGALRLAQQQFIKGVANQ